MTSTAKAEQIDEATLRRGAEIALVTDADLDVCKQLPGIIKTHAAPEWQEAMIVCQLRAGDVTAAQLALDVMHTQSPVKDDVFFQLAERNVINGGRSPPRQLTPLKPISLALLRLMDQAL